MMSSMRWTSLGLLLCLCATGWSPKAASAFVTNKHVTHPQRSTISPSICSSGAHRELFSSSDKNDMDYDEGGSANSRREVLRQATAVAGSTLASWWLWGSEPGTALAAADETAKKRICVTGCTSGIGLDAATRLAAQGHELLLAGRTTSKAQAAAARILETVPNANIGLAFECNLASLSSIQTFASQIQQLASSSSSSSSSQPFVIDTLCLNAGLSRDTAAKDVARTADGFELTVGTNHLGHFYLNQLLLPMMNKSTGRIVVTASGVHDPESPGGNQGETATLGDLKGLEQHNFDMVDGGPFSADKAYKDSKLCNVLFTRELQRRLTASGSGITANCFSPGLILDNGFFRNQNPLFVKAFKAGVKVAGVGETSHWGGGALEYIATSSQVANQGGVYFLSPPGSSKYGDAAYGREFKVAQVSKEAQDDSKAKRLWELSETLVAGSSA